MTATDDGRVLGPERQADVLAIRELAVSYAHAVDDRDWARFEALFASDATIDYTASGGMTGSPAEVAAWMPDALSVFTWSLHSISTHEVRFTGSGHATGRVHLVNRNGVEWEGEPELLDIIGLYLDEYVRVGERWRFAVRRERILSVVGGRFADVVRSISELGAGPRDRAAP
jgi:hypothetical protein